MLEVSRYRVSVDGRGTHLVLGGRVLLSGMAPDFGTDCKQSSRRARLRSAQLNCRIRGTFYLWLEQRDMGYYIRSWSVVCNAVPSWQCLWRCIAGAVLCCSH